MEFNEKEIQVLQRHLPDGTVHRILEWIKLYNFSLKITKPRTSKLGDYRSPFRGQGHRISVNRNLNKYAFLVTLVHEIAHLVVWEKFRNKVKPHGSEWKKEYALLMTEFLEQDIFPDSLQRGLIDYMENPAASSCADANLYKILKSFDPNHHEILHLEDIPENSIFRLVNGRIFVKKDKLRKRYRCLEVQTKRMYLVNPLAEVQLVGQQTLDLTS